MIPSLMSLLRGWVDSVERQPKLVLILCIPALALVALAIGWFTRDVPRDEENDPEDHAAP